MQLAKWIQLGINNVHNLQHIQWQHYNPVWCHLKGVTLCQESYPLVSTFHATSTRLHIYILAFMTPNLIGCYLFGVLSYYPSLTKLLHTWIMKLSTCKKNFLSGPMLITCLTYKSSVFWLVALVWVCGYIQ